METFFQEKNVVRQLLNWLMVYYRGGYLHDFAQCSGGRDKIRGGGIPIPWKAQRGQAPNLPLYPLLCTLYTYIYTHIHMQSATQ